MSPLKGHTFKEYFVFLGMPFTTRLWIYIIFALIYLGCAFRVLGTWRKHNSSSRSPCAQLVFVVFHSVRSCTSYDVETMGEEPSLAEQIIVTGFVIFAFTVTVAYTATLAAYLMVTQGAVLYPTLASLFRIPSTTVCTYDSSADALLRELPVLNVKGINGTAVNIMDALGGSCDAAVLVSSQSAKRIN